MLGSKPSLFTDLSLFAFSGMSNTSGMTTMLCYTSTCEPGTLFDGTCFCHRRAIVMSVINCVGSRNNCAMMQTSLCEYVIRFISV